MAKNMFYLKKLKKIFFLILLLSFIVMPLGGASATSTFSNASLSPASADAGTDIASLIFTFDMAGDPIDAGTWTLTLGILETTTGTTLDSVPGESTSESKSAHSYTWDNINIVSAGTNLEVIIKNLKAPIVDTTAFNITLSEVGGASTSAPFTVNGVGAGTKRAGDTCNPDAAPSECLPNLDCDSSIKKCVPVPGQRRIGTWCQAVQQCEHAPTDLTCDKSEYYCVGSLSGTPCLDDDVNQDLNLGIDATTLDSGERCDTGLVCDPDEGTCVNDWGQTKIPAGKLGETATDIRDQIRNLINIALGFLGVAGVIVTIYGGALWMSAAGDDEKVGKAKKTIVSGLIGLVIIGIAWTIVSYVLTVTQDIA